MSNFQRDSEGRVHDRLTIDGLDHVVFAHNQRVAFAIYGHGLSIDVPSLTAEQARWLGELFIACADDIECGPLDPPEKPEPRERVGDEHAIERALLMRTGGEA